MTDKRPETPPGGDALEDQNTMIFLSLFLILLAFFVMLNAIATRDPSKVEAAVSSLTETFAKSSLLTDSGSVSAKSGSLLADEAFFDEVDAILRARRNWGGAGISTGDGYLSATFSRDELFLKQTGVLKPAARDLARAIAEAIARGTAGTRVRSVEIRVVATPSEMADRAEDIPVPVRQAAGFADVLARSGVGSEAIGLGLRTGTSGLLEMTFYSDLPVGAGDTPNG